MTGATAGMFVLGEFFVCCYIIFSYSGLCNEVNTIH